MHVVHVVQFTSASSLYLYLWAVAPCEKLYQRLPPLPACLPLHFHLLQFPCFRIWITCASYLYLYLYLRVDALCASLEKLYLCLPALHACLPLHFHMLFGIWNMNHLWFLFVHIWICSCICARICGFMHFRKKCINACQLRLPACHFTFICSSCIFFAWLHLSTDLTATDDTLCNLFLKEKIWHFLLWFKVILQAIEYLISSKLRLSSTNCLQNNMQQSLGSQKGEFVILNFFELRGKTLRTFWGWHR